MHTLLTLVGLSFLIVLHELGHYALARWTGMKVLKFSVGFGPVLLSKKYGDTVWQWALIPLGGFVHIHGIDETPDATEDTHSYAHKKKWQRALVIAAGPLMNWVVSACLITAVSVSVGFAVPDTSQARIGDVLPQSPAEQAGLRKGDQLLSIAQQPVHTWADMVKALQPHAKKTIQVDVQRENAEITLTLTPDSQAKMGVLPYAPRVPLDVPHALVAGCTGAWKLTVQYSQLLWGMVTGGSEGKLSGLPGLIKSMSAQASLGFTQFVESLAWLSIGLALFNLLPVPALDGGRLLFLAVETVLGKPLNARIEQVLHTLGFALLIGLMVFASVRDLL